MRAVCLDITRLVSRQGRGALTGIDRVERAYLRAFSRGRWPLYLLSRTRLGYILVGPDHAPDIIDRFEGVTNWGPLDLVGRVQSKGLEAQRRAEADLRRAAIARSVKSGLGRMLARHVPPGTHYFNVGHSNLTTRSLSAWSQVDGARRAIMIHDTIPLDHPEFQRPETEARFEAKLRAVSALADLVIHSSHAAAHAANSWFEKFGRVPERLVAPLGVDAATPDASAIPQDLALEQPYFVTVGTIEPRKNHALLLDAWDAFDGGNAPRLLIAGRRGWKNEHVFKRLDTHPMRNVRIFERDGLSDGAIAALVQKAAGALYPSLAEGFGLAPLEAATLGSPLLCSDLPVTRELLGNIPVYARPKDVYDWQNKIRNLAAVDRAEHPKTEQAFTPPNWDDHFNLVLNLLCDGEASTIG